MIFRQFFDYETWTYTYLLGDEVSREAVLIDSVDAQAARDVQQLQELGLELKYLMETHVHADHVTGVSELKRSFPAARSIVSRYGGAECADILTDEGDVFYLGAHPIRVIATPGHTNGCVSYVCDDKVFTGDALLIRSCGRTDFQQGDPARLYDSIQKLFALPDSTWVYPGHNYAGLAVSTIGEEKAFNPRLAGKTKAEFIEIMRQLKLPHPKKIAESVPANLKCGQRAAVEV